MLRRSDIEGRLERALEGGPLPHDAETRRCLAAAGALAPGHKRSQARIQATHDAMMLAFQRTLTPVESRSDAGTSDGLEEVELHRREVALPGGGSMIVSDLEEITADRLDETVDQIATALERRSKDRQP
ncbi:hypothetical protein [Streptomyces anulatus]|uniref:hypothetical protein n=1 Tax=Streptomyces anulatus TaxID=1892 RepID=UPI0037DC22CF|nr:hypothetical protein OHB50_39005 [Streptomyces anulatus]